jgi:hypothetical protein
VRFGQWALRDTLLRLAEPPCSLYLPRWSKDIIEETRRTLEDKLDLTSAQTAHLFHQLQIHFADAWVEGYDRFISAMANHPKDRHVLAAAVVCGAQTISMRNTTLMGPWVRRFLLEHLVAERNLARNTQRSYRDTMVLLLPFMSRFHRSKVV